MSRRRSMVSFSLIVLLGVVLAHAQPPRGPDGPGRFGDFRPGGGPPGGPPNRPEIKLVKEFDANKDGVLDHEERQAARKSLADRPRSGPGFGPPGGRGGRRGGPPGGPPGGGPGGGPYGRANREPPKPGPKVSPEDVEPESGGLYDPAVFRTLFIDFENDDWETELQEFKETDVEVPATLTVDGVKYPNVGVKFRGMSSFMMIPAGSKRSLNLSMDLVDKKQRLEGYKTLNLLNCNGDPSMMSSVLYSQIARQHIPAPKANFVRVVINGECWGVYSNAQQMDKIFTEENFKSDEGTRWKVKGSPGGDGGLRYLGDDIEQYKTRYNMKSPGGKEAWQALVELCRVLKETPDEQLEEKLKPILDIDGVLWFLALDNALVNSDGYWTRASDYYLYRDKAGKFHVVPHDMNEAFVIGGGQPGGGPPGGFGPPGGPGGFGPPPDGGGPPGFGPPDFFGPPDPVFGPPPDPGFGPPDGDRGPRDGREGRGRERDDGDAKGRGPDGAPRDRADDRPRQRGRGRGPGGPGGMEHGSVDLDPLVGLENERTPLRGRLLKLPNLREQYLAHVREIAESSLDWDYLGPIVAQERALIEKAVEQDTRKLGTTEAFTAATSPKAATAEAKQGGERGRPKSLRDFAEQRRKFLLEYKYKAPMKRAD